MLSDNDKMFIAVSSLLGRLADHIGIDSTIEVCTFEVTLFHVKRDGMTIIAFNRQELLFVARYSNNKSFKKQVEKALIDHPEVV